MSPFHPIQAVETAGCLALSCACVAFLAIPAAASAQQAVFLEAFSEFTAAVEGTFGDEGPLVGAALEKMSEALDQWDRDIEALEVRVGSAPAAVGRVALARMYADRGRLADAQRELDAASRLDPRRADVHVLRGLVLEASGRSTEAAEAFRTAWTLNPDDPVKAYLAFGRALRSGSSGDAERAHADLAAAYGRLVASPKAASSSFPGIGLFHGRTGGAPIVPLAAYAPGYARMALGDYAGAVAELERAAAGDALVADPASRSPAAARAIAALREGRVDEARTFLEGSAPRSSSEVNRVSGLVYWAGSEYDMSLAELSAAVAERPRDDRPRLAVARVLSSAGRHADAARALEETVERLPESTLAWWWLGLARERLGDFDAARAAFERAAAGALAGGSSLHASVGRRAVDAADFARAVDAFTLAVDASPNDATMHLLLAGALQQVDRTREAFVELIAAVSIDPGRADAHARIGQLHLDAGSLAEAAGAFRRAIELSPSYLEARYGLATTLGRLGKTREAREELARVEEAQREQLADRRRGMLLDVLKEEAAVHAAEGRHDRAAALWRQVLEREPGRASNHLGLAVALARAGQVDAAIVQYEQAITMGADPDAYRQLAAAYERAGRTLDAARARAMYDKAARGVQPPPR